MVASAQGLDVSNFQGSVNWGTLSKGLSFAFAKATESTTFTDAYFAHNWQGMASAGLHRGAYHFFHPAVDAAAQARYFVNAVKAQGLRPGDILAADVEITAGEPRHLITAPGPSGGRRLPSRSMRRQDTEVHLPASLTTASVASAAKAFCDEVRALAGPQCPVLIYTNLSVGNTLTGCGSYPLWMAYPAAGPPPVPSPWSGKGWKFWQWGYSNSIDADAFNGTASVLTTFIASYQPGPAPGGSALTPAVCAWQNRRFEFGLAPFGGSPRSVYFRSFTKTSGAWKADQKNWTDIGGNAAAGSGVSAAITDEGEVFVAVIGTDGAMWHNSQPPGGRFSSNGWVSDGGKFA